MRWRAHSYIRTCEGRMPTEIGLLGALWQLSMGNNRLTGACMTTFAAGTVTSGGRSLSVYSLRRFVSAFLAIGIPTEIGLLAALLQLDLDNNQLAGEWMHACIHLIAFAALIYAFQQPVAVVR